MSTARSSLTRRVFDFWFGEASVDAEIRSQFLQDVESTVESTAKFESLQLDPQDALAGTILLDQFTRNMFRDSPRMFAHDPLALQLARVAVKKGFDMQISHPLMRTFFYMPFMHSEDLVAQDEGMELFQKAFTIEPEESPYKENLAGNISYMKRHRDIIAKFGRFPHRNENLGRTSTAEETAFLTGGGDTFDSRQNKK
ncbi:putative transmembrane protein [Paramicrosporidium saccamoebae]|uniref:Putative transmembrane protein n=1 Tax=Paramicrosporidium saccamoebae TaxID=1246581 RepID=A0A2H9TIL7_9FUNG|nr:putative transmembrane protein [Paramicrosporidium saccamoebae]